MVYDLGKVATTNDVASGFSTSSIMGNQRETLLTLNNMQNYINQGFNGLNTQILTGVNDINSNIASCCCQTQRAIDGVNYNMAKNTCDIIQAVNCGVQRLVDLDTKRQLDAKDSVINSLERKLGNIEVVNMLRPVAQPAYITCSPYEALFPQSRNNCCGC